MIDNHDRAITLATKYLQEKDMIFEGSIDTGYMGSAVLIAIMCKPIEDALDLNFPETVALARGVEALKNWMI